LTQIGTRICTDAFSAAVLFPQIALIWAQMTRIVSSVHEASAGLAATEKLH
jgi:hypothetical protein